MLSNLRDLKNGKETKYKLIHDTIYGNDRKSHKFGENNLTIARYVSSNLKIHGYPRARFSCISGFVKNSNMIFTSVCAWNGDLSTISFEKKKRVLEKSSKRKKFERRAARITGEHVGGAWSLVLRASRFQYSSARPEEWVLFCCSTGDRARAF